MAVQLPHYVLFIRIGQAVLTFITMALTAYAASVFGAWSGFGLSWFVFVWTFAFLVLVIFIRPRLSQAWSKNDIILLIPECATAFWWLVTFAVLAYDASVLGSLGIYFDYAANNDYGYGTAGNAALGCTKGAAACGALIFVSFLATIGLYIAALMRNKRTNGGAASQTFNSNFNHVSGEPKMNNTNGNGPSPYPQQPQQYQQQQQQPYQFQQPTGGPYQQPPQQV